MAVRWYSKGAFANGVLYTLVESARANELMSMSIWNICSLKRQTIIIWRSIRYRQSSALVKRTARAVPFKKEQKKCLKHWCRYYSRNSGFFSLFPLYFRFYTSFIDLLTLLYPFSCTSQSQTQTFSTTPTILCAIAKEIGGFDKISNLYYDGNWSEHWYARVTIGNQTKITRFVRMWVLETLEKFGK